MSLWLYLNKNISIQRLRLFKSGILVCQFIWNMKLSWSQELKEQKPSYKFTVYLYVRIAHNNHTFAAVKTLSANQGISHCLLADVHCLLAAVHSLLDKVHSVSSCCTLYSLTTTPPSYCILSPSTEVHYLPAVVHYVSCLMYTFA